MDELLLINVSSLMFLWYSQVLGLSLLSLAFSLFLTVASRLLYPYNTDVKTSRLMVKRFPTVRDTQRGDGHPERFTELHGEEKRKEGDRGDQEKKREHQKGREQSSQ